MRKGLHHLAQSGAADKQVPGYVSSSGLWVPRNTVHSIVAGANVTVNNTDPFAPIVSATGGGGGGGGAGALRYSANLSADLTSGVNDVAVSVPDLTLTITPPSDGILLINSRLSIKKVTTGRAFGWHTISPAPASGDSIISNGATANGLLHTVVSIPHPIGITGGVTYTITTSIGQGGGGNMTLLKNSDFGHQLSAIHAVFVPGDGASFTAPPRLSTVVLPGYSSVPGGGAAPTSQGKAIAVNLPAAMKLRGLVVETTIAGTGTVQWGLFDASVSATAAVKVAGGSGTLNGTGALLIAATSAPVSVPAGGYVLVIMFPAANVPTVARSTASISPSWNRVWSSYVWSDTPDLTSVSWAASNTLLNCYLKGDLDAANHAWW